MPSIPRILETPELGSFKLLAQTPFTLFKVNVYSNVTLLCSWPLHFQLAQPWVPVTCLPGEWYHYPCETSYHEAVTFARPPQSQPVAPEMAAKAPKCQLSLYAVFKNDDNRENKEGASKSIVFKMLAISLWVCLRIPERRCGTVCCERGWTCIWLLNVMTGNTFY